MNFPRRADHLLFLNRERCVGCTHCIRSCPTEAIRIRRGKAEVMLHRCIQCGDCIRVCPRQAWEVHSNSYEKVKRGHPGEAILDPVVFWQFGNEINPRRVAAAFLELGFIDVHDLGEAIQIYESAASSYLASKGKPLPPLSSTCPAVVQLVQVKYPSLIENLVPIMPPYQIMAQNWKKGAFGKSVQHLYYIVPCLAQAEKIQEFLPPEGILTEAIPLVDLYNSLKASALQQRETFDGFPWTEAAISGMKWAAAGGESKGMGIPSALVVDGIHSVAKILELAENGLLDEVAFIEAWACPGGCLGGPLTVQNPFFAKYQLEEWLKRNEKKMGPKENKVTLGQGGWRWEDSLSPRPGMRLDEDLKKAMEKLGRLDEIIKHFPGIDCGACGCPTCLAFAEDVVQGYAREKECLYLMKQKIRNPKQNIRKK
jgi:NAD-dependent dihydropyrimidine dehydrogenase PreA subunit